jgi:hypothetical protein
MKHLIPILQCSYQHYKWQNGGQCDNPKSVGVIAKEYLFCSRERWGFEKAH